MTLTTETKTLIGVFAATAVIVVGAAWLAGQRSTGSTSTEPVAQADRLVRDDDPVLGSSDAAVTVVEFGDFQCPACGALHPVLKQVKEDMADQSVRFVYRQFPLRQHEHAQLAAEASLAAQAQNKFWEYHDLLFENQTKLAREDLERYAEQVGLTMDPFRQALSSGTYRERVQQDVTDGNAVNVAGTPSLFINAVPYTGSYSVSAITAAIQAAQPAN